MELGGERPALVAAAAAPPRAAASPPPPRAAPALPAAREVRRAGGLGNALRTVSTSVAWRVFAGARRGGEGRSGSAARGALAAPPAPPAPPAPAEGARGAARFVENPLGRADALSGARGGRGGAALERCAPSLPRALGGAGSGGPAAPPPLPAALADELDGVVLRTWRQNPLRWSQCRATLPFG
jgi:hypothetical protein